MLKLQMVLFLYLLWLLLLFVYFSVVIAVIIMISMLDQGLVVCDNNSRLELRLSEDLSQPTSAGVTQA